jgi:two-component system response regulator
LSTHSLLLAEDSPEDTDLILAALAPVVPADMVMRCSDGVAALDYLLARGAHAGRGIEEQPRVAILDLNLPKIGGLEVLRELRENPLTRLLPVVMLSASTEQRDVRAASLLGANSFVRKPLDYGRLRETVALLGRYWLELNVPPPQPNHNS